MRAVAHLQAARELLSDTRRWWRCTPDAPTEFKLAEAVGITDDDYLVGVDPNSGNALAMDITGAIKWAAGPVAWLETREDYLLAMRAVHAETRALGYLLMCQFNDDPARTPDDMLAVLDRAIAKLQETTDEPVCKDTGRRLYARKSSQSG